MNSSEPPAQSERVRRTLPEHFAHKDRLSDTAGTPWKGRDYAASPFPEDRGEQDPSIHEALAALDGGGEIEAFVRALAGTRVLIPIQAIATDTAVTASGHHADNASDMAMVKIELRDSQVALPVFTSVAELSAWNPTARPVPMVIEQAAQSAVAEGCTMLLVDLARHEPVALTRSALWALAQGRPWIAPHRDPEVIEVIASLTSIPEVLSSKARAGDTREVELVLTLEKGLTREHVQGAVGRIQEQLARSHVIAERVSSLKLSLR